MRIEPVGEADLADLLPMMRAYCDFYEVAPSDADLAALARALIADPEREGIQLIARGDGGEPLGFATLYWTWQTLSAARAGVMNDLFVVPEARGQGVGRMLIEECSRRAGEHWRPRAGLGDHPRQRDLAAPLRLPRGRQGSLDLLRAQDLAPTRPRYHPRFDGRPQEKDFAGATR